MTLLPVLELTVSRLPSSRLIFLVRFSLFFSFKPLLTKLVCVWNHGFFISNYGNKVNKRRQKLRLNEVKLKLEFEIVSMNTRIGDVQDRVQCDCNNDIKLDSSQKISQPVIHIHTVE